MRGFYNLVLCANLTQKSFDIKIIPDDVTRKYLGGKGLATHLLLRHNPAGVDPFGRDNHLILAVGPAAGTGLWGSCRYGVFTKSPQTGFYAESYSGGAAAEYMTGTGFDAFMLEGASDEPVWLEIAEDRVIFHPAADLWGRDARAAEDTVKKWIARNRPGGTKCGVVAIGPAGENMVSFAVMGNGHRQRAGRTGAAAVMGSKKIKALAFFGTRRKELFDKARISGLVQKIETAAEDDPWLRACGSMGGREASLGASTPPDAAPRACSRCLAACGPALADKNGGRRVPTHETVFSFGSLCDVEDFAEVLYLNDLCDRLGMDAVARLLSDIAHRRGHGEILAGGIRYAADKWEMPEAPPRTVRPGPFRERLAGAAEMFAEWEDRLTIFDSLILCRFYRDLYRWDSLGEIIRSTTGLDLDVEAMRRTASEVIDNTRRFNVREKLAAEGGSGGGHFSAQSLSEAGEAITEGEMLKLLQDYYRARGWDEKGIPPDLPVS